MESAEDAILVARFRGGDERAFLELIQRYEYALSALIRYQVRSPEDAEDLFQETLIAAWQALPRLREPERARAWLMQIARNRCKDFYRPAYRREILTDEPEFVLDSRRSALDDVPSSLGEQALESLESLPGRVQTAARLFYLEGLTIAEIAARHSCPEGTVKRQLFTARDLMRASLGILERKERMSTHHKPAPSPAFPRKRPEIVVEELPCRKLVVDCPELRWWFAVPRLGEQSSFGYYRPSGWKLTDVTSMNSLGAARVEGVDGVQIEVSQWKPGAGWDPLPWYIYGQLADSSTRYLATTARWKDTAWIDTFLNPRYQSGWPEMDRRLEDLDGIGRPGPDVFEGVEASAGMKPAACGACTLRIGAESFVCLRMIQLEGRVSASTAPLTLGYIREDGRTLLVRHYCHPGAADPVDDTARLIVDGQVYVHWFDCLSNLALGDSAARP